MSDICRALASRKFTSIASMRDSGLLDNEAVLMMWMTINITARTQAGQLFPPFCSGDVDDQNSFNSTPAGLG